MLTPKQLKNYDFQSVGRNAYKASEVDTYMEKIYESYEQMFRENGELVKKMSLLADKLAEYKNDSDNIRNALITAERMKDKIIQEAEDQAKETITVAEEKVKTAIQAINEKTSGIMEKATANADKIVADAQTQADEIMKNAQENSTELLSKAQKIYDEKILTIKSETQKEKLILSQLKKESTEFHASLSEIYKTHLEKLDEIPSYEEYKDTEQEINKNFDEEENNDEKILSDFIQEKDEDNENDSKIDEYISSDFDEEDIPEEQESHKIEESIQEYITNDEEDNIEYAPLEYISDDEKDDNASEYQNEYEEEYNNNNEDNEDSEEDLSEKVSNFEVNVDEFYSGEEDDDVITLKNFFKEN